MANRNWLEMYSFLFEETTRDRLKNENYLGLLYESCLARNSKLAHAILRTRFNINYDGEVRSIYHGFFKHPLILAVELDNLLFVKLFCYYGANVNVRNIFSDTSLHIAVISNRTNIAQTLLEYGADPNAINDDEISPYQISLYTGNYYMQKLLENYMVSC